MICYKRLCDAILGSLLIIFLVFILILVIFIGFLNQSFIGTFLLVWILITITLFFW